MGIQIIRTLAYQVGPSCRHGDPRRHSVVEAPKHDHERPLDDAAITWHWKTAYENDASWQTKFRTKV